LKHRSRFFARNYDVPEKQRKFSFFLSGIFLKIPGEVQKPAAVTDNRPGMKTLALNPLYVMP